MECLEAGMDIYCKHSGNPFRIRVHGPNTSLELMLITLSAYTLNKLSLIPFMEDVELVQLYQISLQLVIESKIAPYENKQFVMDLLQHLERWQLTMQEYQSWMYTRSAFYFIQKKLKLIHRGELLEEVMFRRGLLEIDKNGFLEHAKNLLMGSGEWERLEKKFKDGGIVLEKGQRMIERKGEGQLDEGEEKDKDKDKDKERSNQGKELLKILQVDDEISWKEVEERLGQSIQMEQLAKLRNIVGKYQRVGIDIFLTTEMHCYANLQRVLNQVLCRANIYNKVCQQQSAKFLRIIAALQMLITNSTTGEII